MGCGASTNQVPFIQTIAGPLCNAQNQMTEAGPLLQGKIKLVLFSANVPGVREFAQYELVPLYQNLKSKGEHQFEVIFVSDDTIEQEFGQYLSTMPWWAVPFGDMARRNGLHYILDVQGPALVVIDENDDVVTVDGMQEVKDDPMGNNFPWKPSKVAGLMAVAGDLAG